MGSKMCALSDREEAKVSKAELCWRSFLEVDSVMWQPHPLEKKSMAGDLDLWKSNLGQFWDPIILGTFFGSFPLYDSSD